jgi:Ca-activated chloride channel family protein
MKRIFLLFAGAMSFLLPEISKAQMAITSATYDQRRMAEDVNYDLSVKNSYDVVSIDVDAVIKDQMAEVTVSQTLFNASNFALEVEIYFPLPNAGIVQNFTMMVDGKEVKGELMKQEDARGIYEEIVRRKKDPAIMEYVGYGLFKTSVFPIPVGQERKISVTYTQILDRKMNLVNFTYPFGTQKFSARALKSLKFNARIESSTDIKNIYSPTDEIKTDRDGNKKVKVSYEKSNYIPSTDFKMTWTTDNSEVGATLLSYKKEGEDGYFMLLASPSVPVSDVKTKKSIVFVLDRSGSMAGKKMEQSKKALEFVITNLNEGDEFNIVIYDDRVETFETGLITFNKDNYKKALDFVAGISDGGGTNISGGLTKGMELLQKTELPSYIVFLTDGLPTAGETNESKIASLVKSSNKNNTRLFVFGVGNDVNARLLDRLSSENGGASEYVKPMEDIETAVASLYSSISSPLLTDIQITTDKFKLSSTYPETLPDMFKGGQIVWVGRYKSSGKDKLSIKGKANGEEKEYSYDVEFAKEGENSDFSYVEKIWASRRVAHLINEIDLNGKNEELMNELVKLSKDYGILTPYTAFLAREEMPLVGADVRSVNDSVYLKMDELSVVSGEGAVAQRDYKGKMSSNMTVNYNNEAVNTDGTAVVISTMKNVGDKTFFLNEGKWIESTLDEEAQKNTIKITAFSDEYFELAKQNDALFNQYLGVGSNVVFQLNGKNYEIAK